MPPTAWLHAHRGASVDAPENTLAAFKLGIAQGADGIELDVQLSSDGVPVVIHDPTTGRTTGRQGLVRELDARTITQLDTFRAWAGDGIEEVVQPTGPWVPEELRVPTLEAVLEWLPADRGLVIDVKDPAAVSPIVDTLTVRAGAADNVRLISFLRAAISAAHNLAPWLTTGLLLDEGESLSHGIAWAAAHGHACVVPFEADLGAEAQVRRCVDMAERSGISLGTYVVNDPTQARRMFNAGVAFLMSDRPGRIVGSLPSVPARNT